MVNGSRLLARHLTGSKLSLREFADEVGTSASLVWMWRAGRRTPGIAFALKIEKATAGKIRPADWIPSARQQRERRLLRKAAAPSVIQRAT